MYEQRTNHANTDQVRCLRILNAVCNVRYFRKKYCSLRARFFADRWTLAEDNDESTVGNVGRKQFRKDYVGKGLRHQRRIVGGENAVLGVS